MFLYCVQVDASAIEAFGSPKERPLATIGVGIDFSKDLLLPAPSAPLTVQTTMADSILAVRMVSVDCIPLGVSLVIRFLVCPAYSPLMLTT